MVDVLIIGCGIIGAACAYELSHSAVSVTVLEADNDVANGTTKANSAIIHAGYDPHPGTRMAALNVEGSRLAKDLCRRLDVPYAAIGSLVLAFNEKDLETLNALYERGVKNGVPEIRLLNAQETHAMEPNLAETVCGALYAPSAAVVNPWEYALALIEVAVNNGVQLHRRSPVTAIEAVEGGFEVTTPGGVYRAKYILNAAGVNAGAVHELIAPKEYEITPSRGEYYLLDKNQGSMVSHVVFQCPNENGKGVLVSPTVHGNLIVGPNAEGVAAANDTETTQAGLDFVKAAAVRSVPGISFRENIRNFAGVRANHSKDDFLIAESRFVPNFIDLAGIKSPGLSAAPAIAKEAARLLQGLGLVLPEKKEYHDGRRRIRFQELSEQEKNALIQKDPRYGRVICRCETVTEGEIVACLHTPVPPCSVNGVKRRVGAGMGRCQGGFCGPRVQEILARELGCSPVDIPMDSDGTWVLCGETKIGRT